MTKRKVASERTMNNATAKAVVFIVMKKSHRPIRHTMAIWEEARHMRPDGKFIKYRTVLKVLHEMQKDHLVNCVGSQLCGFLWYCEERIIA